MKLVLSRKGFDSARASGGAPSPIFEDGAMCSLPIPDAGSVVAYDDIRAFDRIQQPGGSLGPIVESLTRGRISASRKAHLDPDLRRDALVRTRGWRPIFGQAGAAQSHLANQVVGAGDLFLFFGWFRRAERVGGELKFVRGAPDLHVIWGWMQIGSVHAVTEELLRRMPWASDHPHFVECDRYSNNTVYVAADRLTVPDSQSSGAGVFPRYDDALCLTKPGAGRSTWALPRWFHQGRRPPLSYHGRQSRWRREANAVNLQSAYPGQEFVLDLDYYPESADWLRRIFCAAK